MIPFSAYPKRGPFKLCGAYIIHHPSSGRYYVGSTNDLAERKVRHERELRNGTHPNIHLLRAYRHDPRIEFTSIITETREDAYDMEQQVLDQDFIKGRLFNISKDAREFGYGVFWSEEVRAKISQSNKGKIVSAETREKMRLAKLGIKRPGSVGEKVRQFRLGNKASTETRAKMSMQRRGKKLPPRTAEHIEKIRLGKLNKKMTRLVSDFH